MNKDRTECTIRGARGSLQRHCYRSRKALRRPPSPCRLWARFSEVEWRIEPLLVGLPLWAESEKQRNGGKDGGGYCRKTPMACNNFPSRFLCWRHDNGDISGRAASVCGHLLCLWERFLVSNSARTVRSHQDKRWELTPLKSPVLHGWGINEPSLDWNQPWSVYPCHCQRLGTGLVHCLASLVFLSSTYSLCH